MEHTLENLGTQSEYITQKFYISTNSYISSGDRYLGSTTWTLPAGSQVSARKSFTVPSELAPGYYYVGYIVDATDAVPETVIENSASVSKEYNNYVSHFARVEVRAPLTDGGSDPGSGGTGLTKQNKEAETMSLNGYAIEAGARIAVSSDTSNATGSATFTSDVQLGAYTLSVRVLAEDDGASTLKLYVNGVYRDNRTFPVMVGYADLNFASVKLKPGDTIKLVGQKDGYATRARIDKVSIY